MATKGVSSRAGICGRGGGGSAVDMAAYISRTKMFSEYDGEYHIPKYKEDLVHCEVMLPDHAPRRYLDPEVLWNSVEMNEKTANAQCARTLRMSLPNDWPHELAIKVARDYIRRNFIKKGMCVFFAIHDSVNPETGERNLHIHIMMTMRGIDENGKWMPKQKKVYLTDENGDRIPMIDKKTGQQKVDKQNRKQWKCTTVSTNDWNDRENVRGWRKDLADTINAVNEKIGQTENYWEYRSFKEQGLDTIPQIHLGPRASALERKGIRTERGDINRDIITQNMLIIATKAALVSAQEEVERIRKAAANTVVEIGSEIIDMIRAVAARCNARLKLPIVGGKWIRKIPNRAQLQDKDFMQAVVVKKGWKTFAEMKAAKRDLESKEAEIAGSRAAKNDRIEYLEGFLAFYKDYEPYQKVNAEYWKLRKAEEKNGKPLGFLSKSKAKEYHRLHQAELNTYRVYRDMLKDRIREPEKKIEPKKWEKELAALQTELDGSWKEYSDTVWELAVIETLKYNKKDLGRMLANESHQKGREHARDRNNNR